MQVRELQVEMIRRFDTHSFVVCSVVDSEILVENTQLHVGHAFYEPWRQQALRFHQVPHP